MSFNMKKRTFVRIVSFLLAIIVVLGILSVVNMSNARKREGQLKNQYMQTIADLSEFASSISVDLDKSLYVKTPQMMSQVASKLWRESLHAKSLLDNLPISYDKLKNTNKLLSQVGDYSQSLAKSFSNGEKITKEQRDVLSELLKYCNDMCEEVFVLFDEVKTGSLPILSLQKDSNVQKDMKEQKTGSSGGFSDFEEGFTGFPTMIYDGPFSDHILQIKPVSLQSKPIVSKEKAKDIAAKILGVSPQKLAEGTDECSVMPAYEFTNDDKIVSINKQGGAMCYMLSSRNVGEKKLAIPQAQKLAQDYCKKQGIKNIKPTYYEVLGNVVTFNFAKTLNVEKPVENITIYPDLIKVSVALDNGYIMGFDARGYHMNTKERKALKPKFSKQECKESVSEFLEINGETLCVIPSGGLKEKLCWEYKCTNEKEESILVYINAMTKQEEQIFVLSISDSGMLVK
ncbi:MAG: germination protein YpeB [Oscillospiraceae bacterium]